MESSLKLGRVAGIEVGLNWSWLIVVALVVWALAAAVFPETNPGLSDGAYVAMAAIAALLFFTSLFLHEMGHAIQAQREGMEIDGITLWVFGGVARFKGMFPSAGAELRIAVAGPVVTLAIGVLALAVALLTPLPAAVDGVCFWLGQINLTLLAFNLLPALPLDGGRVLRALLWRSRDDFALATRSASRLGKVFGQGLIGVGLVLLFLGGVVGGIWLAFIGWFLLMAAEAEGRFAETREALSGLRVADAMVRDPVTVRPDLPLDRFIEDVFFRHRHTAYPVAERRRALGLVCFRDVAAVDRAEWSRRPVRELMVPAEEAIVVEESAELGDVLAELSQGDLRRALVCERGELRGLLSITDASRLVEMRTRSGAEAPQTQRQPPGHPAATRS